MSTTKTVAQHVFPPYTVVSVYNPEDVEFQAQSTRAPIDQTPVTGVSASGAGTAAKLDTGVVLDDNAITWTAKAVGLAGNDITVELANQGASQTLEVDVSNDTDIIVSLETDVSSVVLSTGDEVKAAVAAHTRANALVAVADKSTSDGSGVVEEVAQTNLAGGLPSFSADQARVAADQTLTVIGTAGHDYYAVGLVGDGYRYLRLNIDA